MEVPSVNSAFTSNTVNAFTVGYQYWHNLIDSEEKTTTFTFPTGIGFGTNINVPQESYQSKYQFKDDLSINRGNHTFRTGVDYLWEPKLGGFFEFNPTLEIDFISLPSAILKLPQGFSTPGLVGGMTATAGNPYFNLPGGAKMLGLYFQDDWKAKPNLTFNLGVRWDKDFNLIGTEAQGLSRTYLALKAINHPAAASLPKDDSRDFSPRVGFAWDINSTGKHILRGGYGLYYGQTFLNIPLFMIQQIIQRSLSVSSVSPAATWCQALRFRSRTGVLELIHCRRFLHRLPSYPTIQRDALWIPIIKTHSRSSGMPAMRGNSTPIPCWSFAYPWIA